MNYGELTPMGPYCTEKALLRANKAMLNFKNIIELLESVNGNGI